MSELKDDWSTDDIARLEYELRRLYALVIAPPAPGRWPSRRFDVRPGGGAAQRARTPRRIAAVALVAVTALVVATVASRSALTPQPVFAVQMQPAGSNVVCKLPISAVSNDDATGFIVMDHGHATFQRVHTTGTTYVPALGVWAPVLPQMVAPDGRAYVSENFLTDVPAAGHGIGGLGAHVIISVTDAHGTRKLLETTGDSLIHAEGYTANGDILVRKVSFTGTQEPDDVLELLDPATGSLRSLPFNFPAIGPPVAAAGVSFKPESYIRNNSGVEVWYGAFWRDGRTTIWRFDPTTGQATEWFDSTDAVGTAAVVSIDSKGSFIIQVAERDAWHTAPTDRSGIRIKTMLLTAPHHMTVLNAGRTGDAGVAGAFSPLSATMGDEVWLATDDGAIWLYRTGVGLEQIAKVTTSNKGAPGLAISGPCS